MALAVDGGGLSPHLGHLPSGGSPLLSGQHLGSGMLHPGGLGQSGPARSRSIGQSPLLGTHALEANMAAEAARLGILPSGLGMDGRGSGSMGYGLDDRSAAYARAGASLRFGPADAAYGSGYGSGVGGFAGHASPYDHYDLGLDGLGLPAGTRSRRGSLTGGANAYNMIGASAQDMGFDPTMAGRGRRDSIPFQY